MTVLATAVAVIFGWAAIAKARSYPDWVSYLQRDIRLDRAAAPAATGVILLEAALASTLVVGVFVHAAAILSVVVATTFVAFQGWTLASGRPGCRCFGKGDAAMNKWLSAARAVVLLALCAALALQVGRSLTGGPLVDRVVGVMLAVTALVVAVLIDDVVRLVQYRHHLFSELRAMAVAGHDHAVKEA